MVSHWHPVLHGHKKNSCHKTCKQRDVKVPEVKKIEPNTESILAKSCRSQCIRNFTRSKRLQEHRNKLNIQHCNLPKEFGIANSKTNLNLSLASFKEGGHFGWKVPHAQNPLPLREASAQRNKTLLPLLRTLFLHSLSQHRARGFDI